MEDIKIKLRTLKASYKSVRDDYKVIIENMHENVKQKKLIRDQIKQLKDELDKQKAKK